MAWITRGLRDGIVTTGYPRRPDGYGEGFRAAVAVAGGTPPGPEEGRDLRECCPTGAIEVDGGDVRLDRGRCILCGRCVARYPGRFSFDPSPAVAQVARPALVVRSSGTEDEAALEQARRDLARRLRALRRSIHVRHVDAGSDGSEEWEVQALLNPVYDVQRLGIFFTASPRHADLLLVTGVGTLAMAAPLRRTWEAMPAPKVVVAAGTDAVGGGLVHPTYATEGGVGAVLPVDVWVPGSPATPFGLLHGILLAVGMLGTGRRSAGVPEATGSR